MFRSFMLGFAAFASSCALLLYVDVAATVV